jgi:hypothetical protein
VLSTSVFTPHKEEALGYLRHEMIHAEHDVKDASARRSARRGEPDPAQTSFAKSETLATVEGFMTMFHLVHPAPSSDPNPRGFGSDHDPAFVELLGAVTLQKGVIPWSDADQKVRSEALGQLQEYYCHTLDTEHQEAFKNWIGRRRSETGRSRIKADPPKQDKSSPAHHSKPPASVSSPGSANENVAEQVRAAREDFFNSLQNMIDMKCKGLTTPKAP